ncbi:hypothetical protein ACQE3E_13130 [Methylomonas sp. MED-D]|uniref:hypothetical protein n=1 Tax=unclassified Methylomonas TaxID=2608980 RepID=UPI0011152C98|nr:hypothetical protein [Methylomonas sp. LWB]
MPLPHIRQLKPELNGTLNSRGSPLSGTRIQFCAKGLVPENCEQFKETITDEQGFFHFNGESELEFFAWLIGDPLYAYGIKVSYDSRELEWSDGGIGYSPDHVILHCEITEQLLCTSEL